MFEDLMNNPYAWLFLSILSIVSTAFGFYTWFAGKKRKELSISYSSNTIIKSGTNSIEKLELKFDGEKIPDLTASKFYIWNSGNEVINSADIVESRPIAINSAKDVSILDVEIIKVSEDTNKFRCNYFNSEKAVFDFDYVEPGQGILVQVLHTDEINNLHFDCKIKGGSKIRNCIAISKKENKSPLDIIDELLNTLLSAIFLFTMIIPYAFVDQFIQSEFLCIIISSSLGALVFVLSMFLYKKIKSKISHLYHREIPLSLTDHKKEKK